MASILNTDLGALYDQWGQRVAFNEGFKRARIDEARTAGQTAYESGHELKEARDGYLSSLASEPSVLSEVDDMGEVDDIGEVDGQFVNECPLCYARFESDTEGFDSVLCSDCVAVHERESFDPNDYMKAYGTMAYTDNWVDAIEHDSMLDSIARSEF